MQPIHLGRFFVQIDKVVSSFVYSYSIRLMTASPKWLC